MERPSGEHQPEQDKKQRQQSGERDEAPDIDALIESTMEEENRRFGAELLRMIGWPEDQPDERHDSTHPKSPPSSDDPRASQ